MLLANLVARGWEVDLVSSPINYMSGTPPESYRGKLYAREVIDGIVHHWVAATARVHLSRRRRAMNYVSFAISATVRGALLPRPDVIWVSSPPLSIGAVGSALARRFRRPWVFEVRDLWPESAVSVGWLSEESRVYRLLHRLARGYATKSEAVTVPSPGLVPKVHGHGARRVELISGAVLDNRPSDELRRRTRDELGIGATTKAFLYLGAHGAANGLDVVLDAAAKVPDVDAFFLLVGDGSDRDRLVERASSENLSNVHMFPAVAKDDVPRFLAAADVCLHVLRPDPLFRSVLATKILEYFSAHRPVVTTVPGLSEELALQSGGAFAPTADELARQVRRWSALSDEELARLGEKSYGYGADRFGLVASVDQLESLLIEVSRG